MIPPELKQLAETCGVLTDYEDVFKNRQEASVESLLAVLGALGLDVSSLGDVPQALARRQMAQLRRGVEPVIVAWDGGPAEFDLTLPSELATGKVNCKIELEDKNGWITPSFELDRIAPRPSPCGRFVTRRMRLRQTLGWGYHHLRIECDGQMSAVGSQSAAAAFRSLLIVAPRRAYSRHVSGHREWGCFLPLYALRSERNWGAGDFTDLEKLAEWTAGLGGSVVGTLPMLAAFLDERCDPSPYAPASRLAWNEFYVDVVRIPELAACPEAAQLVQSNAFNEDVNQLRRSELVEYRRIIQRKRQVLELLSEKFFERKPQQRFAEYQEFLRQHPHAEDYADFRAACKRRQQPWQEWPGSMQNGHLSDDDFDRKNKQYHLYVQWIATAQLESLADAAGGGLYIDLPLGVRPDGYDVWRWRSAYECNASAGSPPDAMWTKGQDWGFPPLHPERIREQGYQHVRDYLTHHLRLARMLRLDHVMQLHRLYWVPHGMRADQGAYVRYRPEEFYAILNIESHRCQTTLIGENLGTVPDEVNQAMEQHNMKPMYVVQYEAARSGDDEHTSSGSRSELPALDDVPAGSIASLNTHDMPTFAAWWRGTDIAMRQKLELLTEEGARREQSLLTSRKSRMANWLEAEGWLNGAHDDAQDIQQAVFKFFSTSEAGVILVNLEDLWLETQPQNVPGTGAELPNWRRKAKQTFEQFTRDSYVLQTLEEINILRANSQGTQSEGKVI